MAFTVTHGNWVPPSGGSLGPTTAVFAQQQSIFAILQGAQIPAKRNLSAVLVRTGQMLASACTRVGALTAELVRTGGVSASMCDRVGDLETALDRQPGRIGILEC